MISCKEYVEIRKKELSEEISYLRRKPRLCVIQVGDNPASNSYIKGKKKDCEEVGIEIQHLVYPENIRTAALKVAIRECSVGSAFDGIIVQLPLPEHINVEEIIDCIPAYKDVDGFRRDSHFSPCTPKGIVDWLEYNKYPLEGKDVVVVGRSKIVGKPLVNMLIDRGATVTCCHSKTKDLMHHTNRADVVVTAIGKPKYFNDYHFAAAEVVIDVGINRDENGKLCGDVDRDDVCEEIYVTPVPGGVGLLTRLALLENVVKAYEVFGDENTKTIRV